MSEDEILEQAIQALERLRGRSPRIDEQIAALRALRDEARTTSTVVVDGDVSSIAAHHSVASGSITGSVIVTGRVEGGVYLGPALSSSHEALAAYRKVLVSSARHLPLRGIDLGAADPSTQQRFDLAAVYVDLETQPSRVDISVQPGEVRIVKTERWSLFSPAVLDMVIKNRRMVLLGDPGSGKSTFVNHLLLCLAAHGLDRKGGWIERLSSWPAEEADVVPVPVLLRDFARSLPRESGTPSANPLLLWRFIMNRLADRKLEAAEPAISDALERGHAILLLDGLDEIPTAADRVRVRSIVEAFIRRFPSARLLVTCRTLSYQDPAWQLEGLVSAELARFDRPRIQRFIDAWYAELRRMGMVRPEEASRLARALGDAVDRKDLAQLAPNPLLLTVMALVHTHKGRLPNARARLYEDTVDLLLWRWDELRADGAGAELGLRAVLRDASCQDVDLQRALWQLAHEAHAQGDATKGELLADIGEHRLEVALAQLHPQKSRDWAMRVIEVIKLRAGLLLERAPGVYTFPHRTFQEYLAGAYLAARANFATEASQLDVVQWREVVLLAVGRLVYVNLEVDRPLLLAYALCASGMTNSDDDVRRVLFAAEVLMEMGIERVLQVSQGIEIVERVRQRLLAIMCSGDAPPGLRIEAGKLLGGIGDPRFDERLLSLPRDPSLGFVEIPSTSDPPEYYVARYPVTVAQYEAYLNAIGRPSLRTSRLGANHPMVGVTFREALGYCEWLTARLEFLSFHSRRIGNPVSLIYLGLRGWRVLPWNRNEWKRTLLHLQVKDIEAIQRMVASLRAGSEIATVGSFPELSTNGIDDLIGNVWQYLRCDGGRFVAGGRAPLLDDTFADDPTVREYELDSVAQLIAPATPSRPAGFRLVLTNAPWTPPADPDPDPQPFKAAQRGA